LSPSGTTIVFSSFFSRRNSNKPQEPGTPEDNTLVDRRAWLRYPSRLYTICQLMHTPDAEPLPTRVLNISPGGINLLLKRPVEAGSLLTVQLPGLDEGCESTVLAYVNNVRLTDEGDWSLGCTFALQLEQEVLDAFGARPHRPPAPDLRNWTRFACAAEVRFERIGETPTRGTARLADLSAAGIGLFVELPFRIGCLLSLELESPDHEGLLSILASVVRVTTHYGRKWRIGCTFVRELVEDELRRIV
jgi:hypothetical protein